MREYVMTQTLTLLQNLSKQAKQLKRAASDHDADDIHDLRVAIRRLRQALRVFSQFYPGKCWKKLRNELSDVMQACGDVRDRDIAIGLLKDAGIAEDSKLMLRLQKERRAADRDLRSDLGRWKRRGLARDFRSQLEA